MPRHDRDRECCAGMCRDRLLQLVFAGQVPNERNVEILLDRLERERTEKPEDGA